MNLIKRVLLFSCLLLLASCNKIQTGKDSQLALLKATNPKPAVTEQNRNLDEVEEIKRDVSSFPEIYDVAVMKGKKATVIAYKVKHLHRFKMKKIEKNINDMLEEKYSKQEFIVSSDYKIFLEMIRLNERMESKGFSKNKAEKRLNEIIKLTNDMK